MNPNNSQQVKFPSWNSVFCLDFSRVKNYVVAYVHMMHTSLYLHHVSVRVTLPQECRICCKVLLWERKTDRTSDCAKCMLGRCVSVTPDPSYRCEDAAAPDEGEQVERRQLSRLVELAVFGFWQVQPPVHFLEIKQNMTRGENMNTSRWYRGTFSSVLFHFWS